MSTPSSPSARPLPKGVPGALTRYRVMAWVTGVFLLTMTIWLVVGHLFLGYSFSDDSTRPALYAIGWTGHGWLYLLYVITAVDLAFRLRWGVIRTLLVIVAGTIPAMSFVAEHFVTKEVHARMAADAARAPAAGAPAA